MEGKRGGKKKTGIEERFRNSCIRLAGSGLGLYYLKEIMIRGMPKHDEKIKERDLSREIGKIRGLFEPRRAPCGIASYQALNF